MDKRMVGLVALMLTACANAEPMETTDTKALVYIEEPVQYDEMAVPDGDTSFKSYMDWGCITNTRSIQYKMQQTAYTDSNGLRRYKTGEYMVAMGSFYGEVGDRFRITFGDGGVIDAVMGDLKADAHTDKTNRYTSVDGSKNVVEFIVETDELSDIARRMGDVSYASDLLWGDVEKVEKMHDGS